MVPRDHSALSCQGIAFSLLYASSYFSAKYFLLWLAQGISNTHQSGLSASCLKNVFAAVFQEKWFWNIYSKIDIEIQSETCSPGKMEGVEEGKTFRKSKQNGEL